MKIFNRLAILVSALIVAVACEESKTPDTPTTDERGNVIYVGTDPDCYEFAMNAAEGDFNASENGVSIKLESVEMKNVVFTLIPGESIKSYRLDVYPKAILYNALLEADLIGADADAVEEYIIDLLTSAQGAGGYIFDYKSDEEEFPMKQFDWMNSNYAQYKLVPDCEYFITVAGCYDEGAQQVASLSISHFKTSTQPLVGNPQIGLEPQTSYKAFLVKYVPNVDCKYFYNWSYLAEEIDEYIDTFGETMMRDFMRCAVSAALDVTDENNLSTMVSFSEVTADAVFATVAIALDANQIPAEHISRVDLSLKEIPQDAEKGDASVQINKARIGATAAWFDVTIEATATAAFYNVVSVSEADAVAAADEATRAAYASDLAYGGYGIKNENYLFDAEKEEPIGSSFFAKNEFMIDLQPGQEYKVAYCAKNAFGQLSDVMFSEAFKTKELVFDNPDACLCNDDFKFELRDATRNGWTYYAEYDWNDMAMLRFQIVAPDVVDSPYVNDENPGTREELLGYLFGSGGAYDTPNANAWWALPSGVDKLGYFGLPSGIEFVVACCAEDINGVVGPVTLHKVSTREVVPGPNPSMKIEAQISADGTTLTCNIISNEDSKQIKYYASSEGSYNELGLHKLLPEKDPRGEYEYADYLRIWQNYAITLGLQCVNTSTTATYEVDPDSDEFLLVGAIAIGEDNGEDCYSDFGYVIYYKGELHDLSEYRTPPAN
ncbi:MAG: hypothetical protein ACI3ZL_02910 [Candidatus Cryptobacteroides sp.]